MFGLNFGVSPIKKWVFAQQMFNDPAAVAAWIKTWLETTVIQTIDNNGERFCYLKYWSENELPAY